MPALEQSQAVSIHKIMLATDFSPVALKSHEYARALAQRFGSEVEIAHALPVFDDEFAREACEEQRRICNQRLEAEQERFRASGVKACHRLSCQCPVGDALLQLQSDFGADLVILGTQSKSALDRFLLGSTADRMIRDATCPVLTVGPHAISPRSDPLRFRTIVLATDCSTTTSKAAEVALTLARQFDAHLYVYHLPDQEGVGKDDERRVTELALRMDLQCLLRREQYDWCGPESSVRSGHPGHGIAELANRVSADLIVMGARARSFWLSHVRRGVTQDVLAEALCPVLSLR